MDAQRLKTKEELVKYIVALEILKKQFSNDTHGCDMDFSEKMCLHIPIVSDLLINNGIDWRRDYDFDMPDMIESYDIIQTKEDGTEYKLSNISLTEKYQKMIDDAPVFQMNESEGKVELYHIPELHECNVDELQEEIEEFYDMRQEEAEEYKAREAEMERQLKQYAKEKEERSKRIRDLAKDLGVDVYRIDNMSITEHREYAEQQLKEFREDV